MPKKFKIMIISLLSAVALTLVCLVGMGAYIARNADDYKHYLAEIIEEYTGMKIKFNGSFSVSVFPWIGVTAEDVSIENGERFKSFGDNLLAAERLELELKPLPLLQNRIELGDVRIDGLKLGLVTDGEGARNWIFGNEADAPATSGFPDDPGDSGSEQTASGTNQTLPDGVGAEASGLPVEWNIGGIILKNSDFSYLDARTGETYELRGANLETGALESGENISLNFSGAVRMSSPKLAGNAEIKAEFSFTSPDNLEILQLDGGFLSSEGLLGQSEASVSLSFGLSGANLDVRQCLAELAGFKLTLSGKGNVADFTFTGPVSAQGNLRQLFALFGTNLNPAGAGALEAFALNAQLGGGKNNEIRISNLTAKLDSTGITGNLLLGLGETPTVSGGLAIDSIVLDNYFPAGDAPEAGNAELAASGNNQPESAEAVETAPAASTHISPGLGLNLDLSLSGLIVKAMNFQNINARLKSDNAVYNLDPFSFNFASGGWSGSASANLREDAPVWRVNLDGRQVSIEEMLKALTGKSQVEGKADLSGNFYGSGFGADAIMKSLGGSMRASAQGSLVGFKLPQINLTAAPGVNSVDAVNARLNNFSASFSGSGGVFNNNDMVFDVSAARGSGRGSVNLGAGIVDYLVIVETASVNLPIRISGPFSDLSYMLDAQAMLTDPKNLQKAAETLIEKHGNDLEDKLGREIERGLGKLFGN